MSPNQALVELTGALWGSGSFSTYLFLVGSETGMGRACSPQGGPTPKAPSGSWLEMQILGFTPGLLGQNLLFNPPHPHTHISLLKFEKPLPDLLQ